MLELPANILETCKNNYQRLWREPWVRVHRSNRWKLKAMLIWTQILLLIKFEPTDFWYLGCWDSHTICDQYPKRRDNLMSKQSPVSWFVESLLNLKLPVCLSLRFYHIFQNPSQCSHFPDWPNWSSNSPTSPSYKVDTK